MNTPRNMNNIHDIPKIYKMHFNVLLSVNIPYTIYDIDEKHTHDLNRLPIKCLEFTGFPRYSGNLVYFAHNSDTVEYVQNGIGLDGVALPLKCPLRILRCSYIYELYHNYLKYKPLQSIFANSSFTITPAVSKTWPVSRLNVPYKHIIHAPSTYNIRGIRYLEYYISHMNYDGISKVISELPLGIYIAPDTGLDFITFKALCTAQTHKVYVGYLQLYSGMPIDDDNVPALVSNGVGQVFGMYDTVMSSCNIRHLTLNGSGDITDLRDFPKLHTLVISASSLPHHNTPDFKHLKINTLVLRCDEFRNDILDFMPDTLKELHGGHNLKQLYNTWSRRYNIKFKTIPVLEVPIDFGD